MRIQISDWRGSRVVALGVAVDWVYHRVALYLLWWTVYVYWRRAKAPAEGTGAGE
jgi:hypothetical protein